PLLVLGDRGRGPARLVGAAAACRLRVAVVRGRGPIPLPLDPFGRARDALLGPRPRRRPVDRRRLVRPVRVDALAGAPGPFGRLLRRAQGDGQGASILRVRVARVLVPHLHRGPYRRAPPARWAGARVDTVRRRGLVRPAPLPRVHRAPEPARLLQGRGDRPEVHLVRAPFLRRGGAGRRGDLVPGRGRPHRVHVL